MYSTSFFVGLRTMDCMNIEKKEAFYDATTMNKTIKHFSAVEKDVLRVLKLELFTYILQS